MRYDEHVAYGSGKYCRYCRKRTMHLNTFSYTAAAVIVLTCCLGIPLLPIIYYAGKWKRCNQCGTYN